MKSLRFLLPLLAALLVSVGFFLPWMGAAWQDRALGHTTVSRCKPRNNRQGRGQTAF